MTQIRVVCAIVGLIVNCAQLPARAGELHPTVRYECLLEPERIEVEYEYTGEERDGDIELWTFLDTRDGYITGERISEGRCHFGTDAYTIAITPIPANENLNGECGMHVFAQVEVLKGKKNVLNTTLGPTCPGFSKEYLAKVILDVRTGKIEEFKRKEADAW